MNKELSINPLKLAPVAWHDIRETLATLHIVMTMAWWDIATRYKRSRLGAFWLTISMGVTIVAMGLVFGNILGQSMGEYLPYLTTGTLFWQFLNMALTEGGNSFVASTGVILQVRLPLFTHVLRVLWRNIIIFAHNILILPLVFLFFLRPVSLVALISIPGFLVFIVNTAWMMLVLAIFCARFRDFSQIMINVMQVMYFVTPIMWNEKLLPKRTGTALLDYNPFFHLINIVRSPICGDAPTLQNWIFTLVMMVVGWIVAILLFGRYRKRIPYWL